MGVYNNQNWPDHWKILKGGLRPGRYTDPAFAQLERDRLWKRVWQFAARVDEIPQIGDYTTYEIMDQSVMIVRVDADTIKAYYNFCRHRATTLTVGCGSFEQDAIICPFHGWKWDLQGNNQYVHERHEFRNGQLQDSDVALKEVALEIFAGFIFISFAETPQPFDEFIAPVRERIESLGLGFMRHHWWKQIDTPANWKVAQEAFHETYHVAATHPQLDALGAQVIYGENEAAQTEMIHSHCAYEALPQGHGRFWDDHSDVSVNIETPVADADVLEGMIYFLENLQTGMDAMYLAEDVETVKSLRGQPIPEGSSVGEEFIKALYTKAAQQNRPMPAPTPEVISHWGGEVFVFPNLLILPGPGRAMMYRVRPKGMDPDACVFEIFSTTGYPEAQTPPRAQVTHVTDPEDPEQLLLIPRQDFANIPRIQQGLHSFGCTSIWLASHNEKIIRNMHEELDRYLMSPL
jgi:phenylpropionate dioxygenase-like ring-hydroxylating dioxygenase large terminal subunit